MRNFGQQITLSQISEQFNYLDEIASPRPFRGIPLPLDKIMTSHIKKSSEIPSKTGRRLHNFREPTKVAVI